MRLATVSARCVVSVALVLTLGLVPSACSNPGTSGTGADAATTATTAAATTATSQTVSAGTTTESVVQTSGGNAKKSRHKTQLPDFTGWDWKKADSWVTDHGLQFADRYTSLPASESAQFGLVTAQEPAAGALLSDKDPVQVWRRATA